VPAVFNATAGDAPAHVLDVTDRRQFFQAGVILMKKYGLDSIFLTPA
jgi:hypothetical protein